MAQVTTGADLASGGVGGARPINTKQIFWASFLTLIAAGIGFAVRGGILGDWGAQFGFTKSELGTITGGGLAGFGITIIICSLFADRVGYKALLSGAFVLHVLSAVITLAATPVFNASGKDATYWCLYVGMFMFALGNGLCEAAINPLTATLYPKQKTHYLNILHAGWPAGLVIGALVAYLFAGEGAKITHLRWEILIATFLVPALWYGLIVLKERFPHSEARLAGVTTGDQIKAVLAPMFIFLIIIHAMVGYVELGTDSWIANILNNVVGSFSLLLFIYVSSLMFALRFFAGPIVHRINPLGLLFVAAVCGAVGLYMLGTFKTAGMLVVAGTIFALGKTFYWPTMLGVAGERFPRTGALGMGLLGGFGMMSAGFLGGPGIGYKQDRNASAYLQESPARVDAYQRYKAEGTNQFLFFKPITGLDGAKVAVLQDDAKTLESDIANLAKSGRKLEDDKNLTALKNWWETQGKPNAAADKPLINEATTYGGQQALKITAAVPVTMAVCYLLLVLYFVAKGGYKQIHLTGEQVSGGVEGPQEH